MGAFKQMCPAAGGRGGKSHNKSNKSNKSNTSNKSNGGSSCGTAAGSPSWLL